ncbi:MAG: tripartite tricarboxylate transporter substrate binding protein [Pseudomonadota bacterium]
MRIGTIPDNLGTTIARRSRRQQLLAFGACLLMGAFALNASAQSTWPTRPVKLVVGTAPGGGVDLMARTLAQPLADVLGQSVVVDNKAGGSGNTTAAEIIRAAPDGYNLMFGPQTQQTVNPSLIKGSPNTARDLVPVALVGRSQLHLFVRKDLGVNTLAELVALARSKPGVLTYNSSGVGTSPHLLGELFQKQAKFSMLHVPYKGSGPALQSLLAGETDMGFLTGVAFQHVKSGRLQMLGVASDRRPPDHPSVPTMTEAGFPGIVFDAWIGIWAPAATPQPVLDRLSKALEEVLAQPAVMKKFTDFNAEAKFVNTVEFRKMLDSETQTLSALVKERNITAE